MNGKDVLSEMERLFTALADKTRLRLLNLMRDDEICVCFFTEVLGESQPKISRHLAYLRKAGIVSARREGKWMHYRIEVPENEAVARILRETLDALQEKKQLVEDYKTLVDVCCQPAAAETIARAPKPEALIEANLAEPEERPETDELATFLL